MNGEPVQDKALTGVLHYFTLYVFTLIAATLLVSLDNMGAEATFTGVLGMISNAGPGIGVVGPTSNYAGFSVMSKLVLSMTMLIGRLEIYPMLMLIIPSAWRKV